MPSIDHDALFKRLLTAFFREFLELFVPDFARKLADTPLTFLDKEQLDLAVDPDRREADLVVQTQLREQSTTILVHLEHQAQVDPLLNRRMFRYFSRFHDQHNLPIFPIALCSYASPRREAPSHYDISIEEYPILNFRYRVIQLSRLDWRSYLNTTNPVAVALMARMRIAPRERWQVKAASLRILAGLPLSGQQRRLIGQFIDIYTPLNPVDERVFRAELAQFPPNAREVIMDTIGSWELRGRKEGHKEGRREGKLIGQRELLEQLLTHKLGALSEGVRARIAALTHEEVAQLGQALLNFSTPVELEAWLSALPPAQPTEIEERENLRAD